MAKIKADEITKILREQIENYQQTVAVEEVGSVISVGDGIARIHGLDRCMSGEMLEFPHDVFGIALNLEEDQVGTVLLGDYTQIREGDTVKRTNRIMSVPVGEALIGRVVDPLGQPLDGKGPVQTDQRNPLERIAPGVVDRQPVREPVQTGIKAIDSMIPIGRGQRELIIGDRQTGKTAIILDTILNQKRRRHDLHLLRDRAEALDGRAGDEDADGPRRDGVQHRRGGVGHRAGHDAVHRAVRRLRDGRIFPRHQAPRHLLLRRSFEARAVLPRNFASVAPAARPRSVSRETFSSCTRACWNARRN